MPANGVVRSSSQGHRGYQKVLGYTPIVENQVITGYNIFDRGGTIATIKAHPNATATINDRYREAIMETIYYFWHGMGVYQ